ncbi:preprotein translocase subunit SecG [Pelomonas sp. SE-A7]|uniref:preprotein translocase subunit SecG n=1 Tax=Pelomonas sp. SE-A7 TaxID=3054953 RepID=UPI00259C9C05|nr:preprotein translocase subunit SecG [Pelomonas sp. SE-A7]MDM4765323.1 preprotein translocase subunit SecG [Pelomonas sp. SE-A7]
MQMMMNLVLLVQLLSALVMIGLVLVQQGKGADMGASFGSGASGSLFGATGSANFLSRSTAVCATLFFVCTLALAYMANYRPTAASNDSAKTVLDRAAPGADAASTPAVPSAVPTALPAASAASN